MPLVRIELIKGRSDREVAAIGVAQYLTLPKEEWK